jgi:aminoglycoside phosphotransferase (APT) family kinase protein
VNVAAPPVAASARLESFLDDHGIGDGGPLDLTRIGDGHSNITCLLRRDDARVVLRRPPLGPLAASANDILREARVLRALEPTGAPVPRVLAVCEDAEVIGAPFYLMEEVDGVALTDSLPEAWDAAAGVGERVADAVVAQLVGLHAIDQAGTAIGGPGRGENYLARQLDRFGELLEANATRPLPELERAAAWLEANRPASPPATVVHGDYRLGNLLFDREEVRVAAILDWELATIGDPLADLGYLTAMWPEAGDTENPMLALAPLVRDPAFPDRAHLAARYAAATGADLSALPWYQALAIWKSAIFLEGSFKRFRAGQSDDQFFATLEEGVPELARWALATIERAS